MKILVIPSWYPNADDGLMGNYHIDYCEALAAAGIETAMLHVQRARLKAPLRYVASKKRFSEQHKGFTTYVLRSLNVAPISYSWQMRRYTRALQKAYSLYETSFGKPDVIHAMVTVPAGYAACRLGEKIGVPVLITEHASFYRRFFTGSEKPYALYALNHARMSAVSDFMAREIESERGVPCDVIPNVADTSVYKPLPHTPSDTLRLTVVCALREGKDVELAAKAAKILMQSGRIPLIHITVVGDGYIMPKYVAAVKELEMDGCTDFVGRKSKSEIAELYADTDILVVTSRYETFCIPAVEALACGVPVVSTRCRGPEQFVDSTCGELCDIGDAAGMANAIESVFKRLGTFDTQLMLEKAHEFSPKSVADKAKAIYSQMIK